MAKISKNVRRLGQKDHSLISRWGGVIKMRTTFRDGKLRHFAECEKSGNTARKPKDLM